jgi:glycosyltransferase involved in cell wall biosynthesis
MLLRRDRPHGSNLTLLAGKTVLFLVSEDWYFWSHRLPFAKAARDAGARVVVAASMASFVDRIRDEGFEPVHIPFDRAGSNPLRDLRTLWLIARAYRAYRPDLVHHIALKPVLYGSLAAALTGVPRFVNALAGMGFLIISDSLFARVFRPIVRFCLRAAGNRKNCRILVQNDNDRALLESGVGVASEHIVVIRGSGVDISAFAPTPEPAGPPIALCVSRMLWDKGIGELVEAAELLRTNGSSIKVRLVGPTDVNPSGITQTQLEAWKAAGVVEVAGHSDDIAGEYARAHIAVLPSYREGLPKSLLEAAACARPIVATDVPGCRDICRHQETGLLVPRHSVTQLAEALQILADSATLRRQYGQAARRLAVERFADSIVTAETLGLYEQLLAQ